MSKSSIIAPPSHFRIQDEEIPHSGITGSGPTTTSESKAHEPMIFNLRSLEWSLLEFATLAR